jgi:hypothetical protein
MPNNENFQLIFDQLKPILQVYESKLVVVANEPGNYYLNSHYVEKYKKEIMIGAVQIKKNYVSFHLIPVYMYPDLLSSMSPQLKKRMQGKSCFNFTKPDAVLFGELAALTKTGFERVRQEKLI